MQAMINENQKEHDFNLKNLKKDYSNKIEKAKTETGKNATQDAWVEIGGLFWIVIGMLLVYVSNFV